MKVGIIYPMEKNKKVKTMRLLKKANIEAQKITLIAEVEDSNIIKELESLGNIIIDISNGSGDNQSEIFKNAFLVLDKLFTKLATDPSKFNFEIELNQITDELDKIDQAKELLKNE